MSSATFAQQKQRRARSQLSCKSCRTQKLKCDRAKPCDQCIKRSREDSCEYLPPAQKTKSAQNVRSRIQHLEKLVVDLMAANQQDSTPDPASSSQDSRNGSHDGTAISSLTPPSDAVLFPSSETESDTPVEGALGRMHISKDKTNYVHGLHWTAILNTISECKEAISDDDEPDDAPDAEVEIDINQSAPTGMNNLLRSPIRRSKAQLIQALPPREETDRLVYQWFNAADPFKYIIHPPSFQTTYIAFWANPSSASVMWIGLLYTILSLSASYLHQQYADPSSEEVLTMLRDSIKYHELAASAGVLADFATPKPHVIEFLHLYIAGLRTGNSHVDIWQLMALEIRLALRMGYHRDGMHFPGLSIFEQEMRRRIWWAVYMMDSLMSFQLGLPSMTNSIIYDTKEPSNLMERELFPEMTFLPPSRPMNELCTVTYMCVKIPYCRLFAAVTQGSDGIKPKTWEEIMLLDSKLDAAHNGLPTRIKVKPFDQFLGESFETVMWTFNLELLYLKTRIVLHRPFMLANAASPRTRLSRYKCVDSAMRILGHHEDIYLAGQRGGHLEYARQYMGSITTNDVLLAAMIICLELSKHLDGVGASPSSTEDEFDHERMIKLLRTTRSIWMTKSNEPSDVAAAREQTVKASSSRKDIRKAIRALGAMLARAEAVTSGQPDPILKPPSAPWTLGDASTGVAQSIDMLRWGPGAQAMPWNLGQEQQQQPSPLLQQGGTIPTPDDSEMLLIDDIINTGNEIDWSTWDQIVGALPNNPMEIPPWESTWQ